MPISPINQRLADQSRHHENRGRLAHAYVRMKTTGIGTVEFEDRVNFGLTFVERPFIAVGHQIDVAEDVDDFPVATGFVTEWDMTDRDHYVGCWVAVKIMSSTEGAEYSGSGPTIKMFHDFTFSGIALKDVPTA